MLSHSDCVERDIVSLQPTAMASIHNYDDSSFPYLWSHLMHTNLPLCPIYVLIGYYKELLHTYIPITVIARAECARWESTGKMTQIKEVGIKHKSLSRRVCCVVCTFPIASRSSTSQLLRIRHDSCGTNCILFIVISPKQTPNMIYVYVFALKLNERKKYGKLYL